MGQWLGGFFIVDLGLAVVILFVLRLLGKKLPFEDRVKAALARVWG